MTHGQRSPHATHSSHAPQAPHAPHAPAVPEGSPGVHPHPHRWKLLALLCAAQFMLILDVTVINVALPSIGADLHLTRVALTWAVIAYTLCFGSLMLLGGRLADAVGARPVLLSGLALFTAASLVTGFAENAPTLIGGRLCQGVGAALLSPAALATITRTFHGPERTKSLGIWAALGGIGFAVGAVLGGVLTAGPGWNWVFFINVPVGLAVLALLPRLMPATGPRAPARIDVPGALVVTAATALLIYGLITAGDGGWTAPATLGSFLGAVALYALFTIIERRTQAPLIDLHLLAQRPVATGSLLMLVATAMLLGFVFLGSIYLQDVHGLSAITTGLLFLPVAVATAVGAHLAMHLIAHAGTRTTAAGGLLIAGAASLALAYTDTVTLTVVALSIGAAGIVPVFVAATTTALGFTTHEKAGIASGLVNTFHEVGGTFGIATVSTIAAIGITDHTPAGYPAAHTTMAVIAAAAAILTLAFGPRGTPHMPAGTHVH